MRYGFRWMGTWPHISLGISAHVWPLKFAHLSLHNPLGVLIIGYRGADTHLDVGVHCVGQDYCDKCILGEDGVHCMRCRYPAVAHDDSDAATAAYMRTCATCSVGRAVQGPVVPHAPLANFCPRCQVPLQHQVPWSKLDGAMRSLHCPNSYAGGCQTILTYYPSPDDTHAKA